MSEPVENIGVLTGDTSMTAKQENVTHQKITSTWSAIGNKRSVANKVGLN